MTKAAGVVSVVAALIAVACLVPGALASPISTTIINDGFEGAFPGPWICDDADPSGTPAYWGVVTSGFGGEDAHAGSHMAYCAGVGHAGTVSSPTYQNDMDAFMTRSMNLTFHSSATLSFWYKIPSIDPGGWDYLSVYVDNAEIWYDAQDTALWNHVTISLNGFVGASHGLFFEFHSNGTITGEGAYIDDVLVTGAIAKATIADAWWSFPLDPDGDGYRSYGLLQWNPNVVGGLASMNVTEKVYYKLASSDKWTLATTTPSHPITGSSAADIQSFTVKQSTIPITTHTKYDFRIDIYRAGFTTPDYSRRDTNDSDLNDVKFETVEEEVDYLPNQTPCGGTACPKSYGFDVRNYHWAAIGINPVAADRDLAASPNHDLSSPRKLSNAGGLARDFVVVNGTTVHARPYYARVQDGAAGPYTIEAVNDPPNLTVGKTLSGRKLATKEVFDLYQVNLAAGHKYTVKVSQTSSSTSNVAIFLFKPTRTTGSRTSHDFYRNAGGVGASEALTFTAAKSGRWGIVVTNENAGHCSYSIKVTRLD